MKTKGNTILITGGTSGIGLALAEAFAEGNEVIICGRRQDRLKEITERISVHIKTCDVSIEKEREGLFRFVSSNHPGLNILINNAGIQRTIDVKKGADALKGEDEIRINLEAPIHLSVLFLPLLMKHESAIVNVSSGLAFVPIAKFPVYCATKAGLHSFSLSLRHQLKDTTVKVFELIPPTVDTELNKLERDKQKGRDWGISPAQVAKACIDGMERDSYEIAVGMAQDLVDSSKNDFSQVFGNMNR